MRRLLNTLFVTSEDAYLTLDGENIVVRREKEEAGRFPLHNLEEIVSFSYAGASPALMGACTKRNIGLSFCTPSGRFLARTAGVETGNVLLRREQYRVADDPAASCRIAKLMIWGKLYNGRWSIERTKRDHKLRIDAERFENASAAIRDILPQVMEAGSLDSLRGLEGAAASVYFEVFDDMILRSKETSRPKPAAAAGQCQCNALLFLQSAGRKLRFRAGERRSGCLCRLSAPGSSRQNIACAGPYGGAAAVHGGPVRADAHQQSGHAGGGF